MNEPNTLDEQIREKIKNCFKRTYMQTEGDTELFDTEITIDELVALFTEHSKQLLLSLPVSDYEDDDDTWFEYISLESRDKLIAQLKRNKGEDNGNM